MQFNSIYHPSRTQTDIRIKPVLTHLIQGWSNLRHQSRQEFKQHWWEVKHHHTGMASHSGVRKILQIGINGDRDFDNDLENFKILKNGKAAKRSDQYSIRFTYMIMKQLPNPLDTQENFECREHSCHISQVYNQLQVHNVSLTTLRTTL